MDAAEELVATAVPASAATGEPGPPDSKAAAPAPLAMADESHADALEPLTDDEAEQAAALVTPTPAGMDSLSDLLARRPEPPQQASDGDEADANGAEQHEDEDTSTPSADEAASVSNNAEPPVPGQQDSV